MTMDEGNRRPESQQGGNSGNPTQQSQSGARPGQAGQDGRMPGQNQQGMGRESMDPNREQGQSGKQAADPSGQSSAQSSGASWQASSQQQQFEQNQGQFSSGASGADGRITDQIRTHMEVMGEDGQSLGRVDSVDGDRIKLTRSDSADDQHHYIKCSDVAGIENDQVHLHAGARSMPGNDGS